VTSERVTFFLRTAKARDLESRTLAGKFPEFLTICIAARKPWRGPSTLGDAEAIRAVLDYRARVFEVFVTGDKI
jgi:hypothetical protein